MSKQDTSSSFYYEIGFKLKQIRQSKLGSKAKV